MMSKKKTARAEMYWDASRNKWRKRKTIGGAVHTIFGDTQADVRRQVAELEQRHSSGLSSGGTATFGEHCVLWYAAKMPGLSANTVRTYDRALSGYILPALGDMPLREITPLHVKTILAGMSGKSHTLQSQVLHTISQVMRSAAGSGLIVANPCGGISAGGKMTAPKEALTDNQVSELLNAVKGTRSELFVNLCLYAGLRRGEALGLMWDNVHLDTDTPYLDVRHAVVFGSNQPVLTACLKTAAAYRSIPLPPALSGLLRSAGRTGRLVISATGDSPMSKTAFRRMWQTVKISFHTTPHILRHTYITKLCASRLDIKRIQYLAGHASVGMTLNTYAHVTKNTPAELYPEVAGAFTGTVTGTAE